MQFLLRFYLFKTDHQTPPRIIHLYIELSNTQAIHPTGNPSGHSDTRKRLSLGNPHFVANKRIDSSSFYPQATPARDV